ncbi:MAG: putative quinol monooxygenase [Pelagimonas sp.]|uniref:putative quinol monooxygenase n=1 Tax=Pelagimonas sp. TaxID=2073170 RepID=UPI003D6AB177
MTVTLEGYLDVPVDRLEAVRAALPVHIQLTRAETGCLRFDVTESQTSSGKFHVSEEFVDAKAFAAHQERTKSSDWARVTEGIPRDYKISGL